MTKGRYHAWKPSEPTPTVYDLPAGAFKGTQDDFEKLSPGMRREILRSARKVQS